MIFVWEDIKIMKIKILIPVYNDWQSVSKLIDEINKQSFSSNFQISILIVNDASNHDRLKEEKSFENIQSIKILNMKINQGHARCIATGLKYIFEKEDFDYVIPMDGDGEDRPEEIKMLVEKALSDEKISVVAKRIKRSEGVLFQMLYQIHKIITLIFTGKNINFGNYSCLTRNDLEILSTKESLWNSFSGSVKKHIQKLNTIDSIRGPRYFGPSKMSLFNLGLHSLSIIAVFKFAVFVRVAILAGIIYVWRYHIGFLPFVVSIFLLIIFNCLIYLISLRENKKDFLNSDDNVADIKSYTH